MSVNASMGAGFSGFATQIGRPSSPPPEGRHPGGDGLSGKGFSDFVAPEAARDAERPAAPEALRQSTAPYVDPFSSLSGGVTNDLPGDGVTNDLPGDGTAGGETWNDGEFTNALPGASPTATDGGAGDPADFAAASPDDDVANDLPEGASLLQAALTGLANGSVTNALPEVAPPTDRDEA
ncbi:hypothetical protein N1F89_07310 [Aquibium sp. A9E412]|uniref:hypothetical protein n=1 Tax=Aquibium sp. A9E412 TaxID=2976767 RepID=UPI0025B0511F|nr:hypothetical protein [Aquibium sp. A9E412]MDN2566024.1 hypothetical protein [Aquibium sp. A9E412]